MVQHCDMHTSAIDILEKRSGIPYDAINGKDVASIHIYTDGSHGLKMEDDSLAPAGWACIICVCFKRSDTLHPIGVFGGQVVLLDNAKFSSHGDFSDHVGSAAHSAGTSEWTAIIWAVLWVIQAGFIVPVVIHADACVQFFVQMVSRGGDLNLSSFFPAH